MVGQETLSRGDRQAVNSHQNNSMARHPGLPENHERAALLRNIPEEIKGLPYFYPKFGDSKAATTFVEANARGPGYFILRLSSKGDNFLSLSVSIENRSVRHVNVIIERHPVLKYYIVEQVKFNSFEELHQYYKEHRICNLEMIANVKLLHPIKRGFVDIEEYEKLHPAASSGSRAIPVDSKNSTPRLPPTPSSQQLNAQWVEEVAFQRNGEDQQYLPGAQGGHETRRRKSSTSRPLPLPPNSGDQVQPARPSNANDDSRPPCPPPPNVGETDLYYSRPRDESRNRIEELRKILRDAEVCDCGVPLADSELPQGWTLHKSHDAKTYGCLFYQSSKGDTTWNLPLHIVPEITAQQRNIIVKLSHQSGKPPPKVLMPPYQNSDEALNQRVNAQGRFNNTTARTGTKGPLGR